MENPSPSRPSGEGLATFLGPLKPAAKPPAGRFTPPVWLIRLSLGLADVGLVSQAAWLVWNRSGPLGALEVLGCLAAFGLGAWLGCLAAVCEG